MVAMILMHCVGLDVPRCMYVAGREGKVYDSSVSINLDGFTYVYCVALGFGLLWFHLTLYDFLQGIVHDELGSLEAIYNPECMCSFKTTSGSI